MRCRWSLRCWGCWVSRRLLLDWSGLRLPAGIRVLTGRGSRVEDKVSRAGLDTGLTSRADEDSGRARLLEVVAVSLSRAIELWGSWSGRNSWQWLLIARLVLGWLRRSGMVWLLSLMALLRLWWWLVVGLRVLRCRRRGRRWLWLSTRLSILTGSGLGVEEESRWAGLLTHLTSGAHKDLGGAVLLEVVAVGLASTTELRESWSGQSGLGSGVRWLGLPERGLLVVADGHLSYWWRWRALGLLLDVGVLNSPMDWSLWLRSSFDWWASWLSTVSNMFAGQGGNVKASSSRAVDLSVRASNAGEEDSRAFPQLVVSIGLPSTIEAHSFANRRSLLLLAVVGGVSRRGGLIG